MAYGLVAGFSHNNTAHYYRLTYVLICRILFVSVGQAFLTPFIPPTPTLRKSSSDSNRALSSPDASSSTSHAAQRNLPCANLAFFDAAQTAKAEGNDTKLVTRSASMERGSGHLLLSKGSLFWGIPASCHGFPYTLPGWNETICSSSGDTSLAMRLNKCVPAFFPSPYAGVCAAVVACDG